MLFRSLGLMSLSNDGNSWSAWEPFCSTRTGWDLTDSRYGGNDSDGIKYVHFKAKDLAGNEVPIDKRVNTSIFLDRVTPANLSIAIAASAPYTTSNTVSLNLTSFDPEPASGLSGMSFSNDGVTWKDWAGFADRTYWSLTGGAGGTDTDGNKTVWFRASDNAGNIGGPVTANIILDRKAPENLSILINGGSPYTNSSAVGLAISATDPISPLSEMALSDDTPKIGSWEPFAPSKAGWDLTTGPGGAGTDGEKTVYLEAKDLAGNVAGPVSATIFLDRQRPGPLTIKINGGAAYTNDPTVQLAFSATDAAPSSGLGTMQFSEDSQAWTQWEPFATCRTYSFSGPDGPRSIYFRVQDRAGNLATGAGADIILDTAPPRIASAHAAGITQGSAVIMWETDEPADSTAEYGLDVNYGSSTTNSSFTQSHTIILRDLRPLTVYHFRVQSTDRAGNPTSTVDLSLTTSGASETIPPQLADIQVRGISDNLAIITWSTNEDADSLVEYGTSTNYGLRTTDNGFVLSHCIVLRGLSPTTTYHFRVGSKDASGNGPTFSADHSFRTTAIADKSPPIVSNVRVAGITDRLAVVSWQTDELADGTAMFGPTVDYGRLAFHIELRMAHQLVLTGLSPSTTYHFRVGSTDASGNGPALSADMTFQTGSIPDLKAPVLTKIRVENVTKTSAVITWETDELSDSIAEYGTSKSYGFSTPLQGFMTQHRVLLVGLSPGKLYHFRVRSTDPSGNSASSNDLKFTTVLNTPPLKGFMNDLLFFETITIVFIAAIAVAAAFRLKSRPRKRED